MYQHVAGSIRSPIADRRRLGAICVQWDPSHWCSRRLWRPTGRFSVLHTSALVTLKKGDGKEAAAMEPTDRHARRESLSMPRKMACSRRMRVLLSVLLTAALLQEVSSVGVEGSRALALRGSAPHNRRLNVFGPDDRRTVIEANTFPYSAIGILRWTSGLSCTASLIGINYVLAAAECVLDGQGEVRGSLASLEFVVQPASNTEKNDQTGATTAKVVAVHRQSDYWKNWTTNTYVILELDTALGSSHGVLLLPTLKDIDQSKGSIAVQMVQFADDINKPTATLLYEKCMCYFPTSFQGPRYMLHHDCDTSVVGSPGAPLLVRYVNNSTYVIGIHSNAVGSTLVGGKEVLQQVANYTDSTANRGILGPFIQMQLENLTHSASQADDADGIDPASSGSRMSTSSRSHGGRFQGSRSRDKDAAQKPASSRDGNASAASKLHLRPAIARICIVFVCCAWACILFIAFRHIRSEG